MMGDIFSAFDSSIFLSIFPLMILLCLIPFMKSMNIFKNLSASQVKQTGSYFWNNSSLVLPSLFIMLIYINFMGLNVLISAPSSHLWFAVGLGLTLWLSLLLMSMNNSLKGFISHLMPQGAPMILAPFLVLIETVSILIRPLTLSVRLIANISAGHIVLSMASMIFTPSSILMQLFYTIFEFGIAVIQSYIFFLLLTLYSND